jgi:mono/diheme cytochrome c family protein
VTRVRSPSLLLGLLVLSPGLALAQGGPDSVATAEARPVAIYSEAQARRGQSTYRRHCVACHTAAAYSGVAFRRVWGGKSPYDLWEQIRTTMPQDNPGQLKAGEYADIVAYLLRLNGYPAGAEELPAEAEKLQQLRIVPRPVAGGH